MASGEPHPQELIRTRLARIDAEAVCEDRPALIDAARRLDERAFDAALLASARQRRERLGRLPVPKLNQDLPIAARAAEIAHAVAAHPVVVLCGETGSGKTTQLPQICLSIGRGAAGRIAHTQPRRLAARAVAARLADELGVSLGAEVGVKVRFGDRTSASTVVKLLTDGMLLAEVQDDPDLLAYDTVIIDEAHERSLNIDFLLGYLKLLVARRPDLRVIVTSATIDTARMAAFFGPGTPVLNVSGRTYPVEVRYRPLEGAGDEVDPRGVVEAVEELMDPALPEGDVLVFLPGEREIRVCADALRRAGTAADVLPLFARLSNEEQDAIFRPGPRARVVLSTNVAETSLTVPRIRYVVDSGLVRMSRYDPAAKVQRLPVEMVSAASAQQRSGRCGRVAAGVAVRLYSEAQFRSMPAFTDPEVRRTNLASVILRLHALGQHDLAAFPMLDPPEARAVADGYEVLFELGAMTAPTPGAAITPLGRVLARLPVEPRLGRMLIAADAEGSLREVLVLAAGLSIQDPRDRPAARAGEADAAHLVYRDETSDFLTLLNIWRDYAHASESLSAGALREWCRARFLSPVRMREWWDTHRQLREVAADLDLREATGEADAHRVHRALLAGLIANVCCKDDALGPHEYRGFKGNAVSVFPGSVLFKQNPRWFMAAEIVQTTKLYARTLARIDPAWVEDVAGHVLQRQVSDKHWDAKEGRAAAWERLSMGGVVVVPRREVPLAGIDPVAAREILLRDGLATGSAGGGAPFAAHNRAVLARAAGAEARLRRRGIVRTGEDLAAWFAARVPPRVVDSASLEAWRAEAEKGNPRVLFLGDADVLKPGGAVAADAVKFPDAIVLEGEDGPVACPVTYRFEPGREDDGVSVEVPLLCLGSLTPERAGWLVPGMLAEKVLTLLKALPKAVRARVEGAGGREGLAGAAASLAEVLAFAEGELAAGLREASGVLWGIEIAPDQWPMAAVPAHQRLRVVVTDGAGHELGVDRDVGALRARLAGRLAKARAAVASARYEKRGLVAWDFGDLPDAADGAMTPVLVDRGGACDLTLWTDAAAAGRVHAMGVRRMLALACGEEVAHRLRATPQWAEIERAGGSLGSPSALLDAAVCLVCERCFLSGFPALRGREEFEARQQAQWGRLGQATMEVAGVLAAMLDARAMVWRRLSGGTNRHWAASIADLREHGAYLMPQGFLALVPWERLREYPRYVGAMKQRLLNLREDGSGSESGQLAIVLPHWKRLTAWTMARLSALRAETADEPHAPPAQGTKGRPALPPSKRAAPVVNTDAGAWLMEPGRLPPAVEAYRWALEEFRVGVFARELGGPPVSGADLDRLWAGIKA